jgi:hypothetical protein
VTAGSGDFDGAPKSVLTFDFVEVSGVGGGG